MASPITLKGVESSEGRGRRRRWASGKKILRAMPSMMHVQVWCCRRTLCLRWSPLQLAVYSSRARISVRTVGGEGGIGGVIMM